MFGDFYTMLYVNDVLDQLSTHNVIFQVKDLQKLVHFCSEEVSPGPTAVQAQLVNKDGTFANDFVFEIFQGTGLRRRVINCKFLPSPAATSSLAIADYIADEFMKEYKLNKNDK